MALAVDYLDRQSGTPRKCEPFAIVRIGHVANPVRAAGKSSRPTDSQDCLTEKRDSDPIKRRSDAKSFETAFLYSCAALENLWRALRSLHPPQRRHREP